MMFTLSGFLGRRISRGVDDSAHNKGMQRERPPFGERKTCSQVCTFDSSPVKSAFALLLERVTEPTACAVKKGG